MKYNLRDIILIKEILQIVYHVRHPKDCLITLHHHYMARRGYSRYDGQLDSLVDQCVTGNITSGPWFDHYISYWQHRNYANVYICSFEDFSQVERNMPPGKAWNYKSRPVAEARKIFGWPGAVSRDATIGGGNGPHIARLSLRCDE